MATKDLVTEVGFGGLSIEGIASRAGVGKQTIYRWWSSKGTVLLDALLMAEDGSDTDPEPLPDTGDLEADLKAVLKARVSEMTDPRYAEPLRALHIAMLQDPHLSQAVAKRWGDRRDELRKARLRSGQRAGELPEGLDLDVAIDILWGPVLNRWLQSSGPLTPDYADSIVESALEGLRHSPAANQGSSTRA